MGAKSAIAPPFPVPEGVRSSNDFRGHMYESAPRLCSYCKCQINPFATTNCTHCGAPLNGRKQGE